jgi:hypothetical protein
LRSCDNWEKTWICFYSHSTSPRIPRDIFPSTHREGNISPHRGGIKEDIGSPIPPTSDTLKKGKPRKNKETREAQDVRELRGKLATEELIMHAIKIELVEGPSQEIHDRQRRLDTKGMNICESSQQLKKSQLTITKLYQENKELRQRSTENTLEASTL